VHAGIAASVYMRRFGAFATLLRRSIVHERLRGEARVEEVRKNAAIRGRALERDLQTSRDVMLDHNDTSA
jgi:hypothetical protein